MEHIISPEQWNQLITILISSVGGLAIFIGLIGRVILKLAMTRIDNHAKTQEAERAKIRDEYKLKFAALEDETKTKDQLFDLNKAHANSYEMVAHSVDKFADKLGDIISDHSSQIEIFGSQLRTVNESQTKIGMSMTDVVHGVNTASSKVDSLIDSLTSFFNDLLERDEASTNSNTQHRQEILVSVRNLQKDMEILKDVQRDIGEIKSKVSHLVDTRPIPHLDDSGNIVKQLDSNTQLVSNGNDADDSNTQDNDKLAS